MQIVESNAIPTDVRPVIAEEVVEAFKVATQMEKICREHDGLGVAAVQVGIPWQLFVIALNGDFRYCVNCTYEPTPGTSRASSIEGCLSLPGRFFTVERWAEVQVEGQEIILEDGKPAFTAFSMLTNFIAFQHEIDHQNGILISDCGGEVFLRPLKRK